MWDRTLFVESRVLLGKNGQEKEIRHYTKNRITAGIMYKHKNTTCKLIIHQKWKVDIRKEDKR